MVGASAVVRCSGLRDSHFSGRTTKRACVPGRVIPSWGALPHTSSPLRSPSETTTPAKSTPGIIGSLAATVTPSLVHQFSVMKPSEFGPAIEPKWQVAQKLVKEIQVAVEKGQLTPLDGARTISSLTATLFGYDEFILREVSPETLLANNTPTRR